MKKRIAIIAIVGVIGAIVAGYFYYNKPHRNVAATEPDFRLSADSLWRAFNSNEAAANVKYLEKTLEVTGKVSQIQFDSARNEAIVWLEANPPTGGINCRMLSGQNLSHLYNQPTITVRGICSGYLMDVVLVRCIVVE